MRTREAERALRSLESQERANRAARKALVDKALAIVISGHNVPSSLQDQIACLEARQGVLVELQLTVEQHAISYAFEPEVAAYAPSAEAFAKW